MYISATGALAQSRRLEVISNNLANVDTPGFKQDFTVMQSRHAEAIERGEADASRNPVNNVGGGVLVESTQTDFSGGALEHTSIPTDFAIDGEGFFQVLRDGQTMLTRAGKFRLSHDGHLLSAQGDPVLTPDGGEIVLQPNVPWSLNENGVIQQGGNKIPLGIVKPQSLGDLVKVGHNYFSPLAEVTPVTGRTRVVSGYVEKSSVQPTESMMQLIETSRAYEANVRMIQNQDNVIGSLVNRVLRQS